MEIQNKIREGNFETFYTVLEEASQKASFSNFILNDLIEVFVYFTFLFDCFISEIFEIGIEARSIYSFSIVKLYFYHHVLSFFH